MHYKSIFWWYKNWDSEYQPFCPYFPVARNWKEKIMFFIVRIARRLAGHLDLSN